jgi:hypothetical protein
LSIGCRSLGRAQFVVQLADRAIIEEFAEHVLHSFDEPIDSSLDLWVVTPYESRLLGKLQIELGAAR